MANLLFFIVSFAILTLTGCEDHDIPLPLVDECTVLSHGAICTDMRLPEDEREYILGLSDMKGYQCTSPDGYNTIRADIDEKRAELAKLRQQK